MHTIPGTSRHPQAEFWQLKPIERLCYLVRSCACLRLTSEGPVVRIHLRPPMDALTCADACPNVGVSAGSRRRAAEARAVQVLSRYLPDLAKHSARGCYSSQ